MVAGKRIKKYLKVIREYKGYPAAVKDSLLDDGDFLKTVSDCCMNVLFNAKLKLSGNDKNKLVKHKRIIKVLSSKKIKLHKKKKLLKLRGGAFLPILFSVLGPLFGGLINKLIPQSN